MHRALTDQLRENIRDRALIPKGGRVLVAVSGGIDSVCLLDRLVHLAPDGGWHLSVAHFNHQLRGEESDQDAAFVTALAKRFGLDCFGGTGDVEEYARGAGISLEMAGRELRHRFMAESARRTGAGIVALGHHADDQIETFWLRLLRGQTGGSLGGMRWSNPSPVDPEILLIRPMFNVFRGEIYSFAAERALEYREDSSNAELRFQRNQIRHEILPVLARFQPAIREITLRTAAMLADDRDAIQQMAVKSDFASALPAVQRELIRQELARVGVRPSFDRIEHLRVSNEAVAIDSATTVRRNDEGGLELAKPEDLRMDPSEVRLNISRPGGGVWKGVELNWAFRSGQEARTLLEAKAPGSTAAPAGMELFDAEELGETIVLRHWRAGDRFQPVGMSEPVKLQDLFTNLKIPAPERRRRWVGTLRSGEIFWVEGLRIGTIARLRSETRTALEWRWRRLDTGITLD